ncbi:MAG: hypothetical protein AAB421_02095 [Patescibacteria group bacterium]
MNRKVSCLAGGTVLGILIFLLSTPLYIVASEDTCSTNKETVVYINGIFTEYDKAKVDAEKIQAELWARVPQTTGLVPVKLAHNPTHLGGIGDVLKSMLQKTWESEGKTEEDFDLLTITKQLAQEVKTQKILILGHSQGTFYANALYDYLIKRGVPAKSLAVYNIATPASYVAGHGKYLTNANDAVIAEVRQTAKESGYPQPLPANTSIPRNPTEVGSEWAGHGISTTYLAERPTDIAGTIAFLLSRLEAEPTRDTSQPCIPPPESTAAYYAKKVAFLVGDPAGQVAAPVLALAHRVGSNIAEPLMTVGGHLVNLLGNRIAGLSKNQSASAITALDGGAETTPVPFATESGPQQPSTGFPVLEENPTTSPTPTPATAPTTRDEIPYTPTPPLLVPVASIPVPTAPLLVAPLPIPAPPPTGFTAGDGAWGGSGGGGSPYTPPTSSGSQTTPAPTPEPEPTPTPETPPAPPAEPEPPPTPAPDTTPPSTPTLTITECDLSLSTLFCLVPGNTVTATWNDDSDAAEHQIYVGETALASTTATSTTLTLSSNATSTLTLVARDSAGNTATSTSVTLTTITQPIILNEVAWAGTTANAEGEWIELKNLSAYTLNISNLAIITADGTPNITLSGTLPPANADNNTDIYLIERTADTTTADHSYEYPFETLSDSGEEVRLMNGTILVDQTPAVATCSGWCAGSLTISVNSSPEKGITERTVSMERTLGTTDGTLSSSWHTNDGYTKSASDSAGNSIYGTPGRENSTGITSAGWYCSPQTTAITPSSSYTPTGTACTYLSGFIHPSASRWGVLFRGVRGSSTEAFAHSLGLDPVSEENFTGGIVGTLAEQFFVALFETRTFGDDLADFMNWFKFGTTTSGSTEPPHTNYRIIEWTYGL